MLAFALVAVLAGFLYTRLPTSFVPDEDQGFVLAVISLPPGSTLQRTDPAMTEIRDKLDAQSDRQGHVRHLPARGLQLRRQDAENVGMAFIKLTPWSKRSQTAMQLIPQANGI